MMCGEEGQAIARSEPRARRGGSTRGTTTRDTGAPSRRDGRRASEPAPERTKPDRKRRSEPRKDEHLQIRLFDADRQDHHLDWATALRTRPTGRQLLWIDITGPLTEAEADAISEADELDTHTRDALLRPASEPHLALHGRFFHLRLAAQPDAHHPESSPWLDVVAGKNLVITGHAKPLRFVGEMDERIERDTTLGLLEAPLFVASILDSVITTYFEAVDEIADEADKLDAVALRDEGRRQLLEDLVAVRQRIGRLRRILARHRDLFASIADADFTYVAADGPMAPAFQAAAARFANSMDAVDSVREAILGSFDIYMTRTAQRTNDVMKLLALATVLLLPGSLIAGLLGMNVSVPLDKDSPFSFWMVLAGVALLAASLLGIARLRRWL
jgi:magnesium transporter